MTDKGTSKIVTALLAARKAMGKVHKSCHVTYANNFSYANMEDILETIEDALADNDLAVITSVDEVIQQDTRTTAQRKTEYSVRVKLTLTLHHISGETLTATGWGEGQDGGDKGIYAAITGGRKYALCALFNLATTDDPEKKDHTTGKGPAFPATQSTATPSEPKAEDKGKGEGKEEKPVEPPAEFPKPAAQDLINELDKLLTVKAVEEWWELPATKAKYNALQPEGRQDIVDYGTKLKEYLWMMDGLRACRGAVELRAFGPDHGVSFDKLDKPYQEAFTKLSLELKASL